MEIGIVYRTGVLLIDFCVTSVRIRLFTHKILWRKCKYSFLAHPPFYITVHSFNRNDIFTTDNYVDLRPRTFDTNVYKLQVKMYRDSPNILSMTNNFLSDFFILFSTNIYMKTYFITVL